MTIKKILKTTGDRFMTNWFVCRITSGRKSAQYGMRFSYPAYISIVVFGVLLENPYILTVTALIAFFGIVLPMHPFDYIYNHSVGKLISAYKIPGRGSELQMSSSAALIFNLCVITSIIFEIQLNYGVMALIYVLINIFFISILSLTDEFSIYSIQRLLFRRGK